MNKSTAHMLCLQKATLCTIVITCDRHTYSTVALSPVICETLQYKRNKAATCIHYEFTVFTVCTVTATANYTCPECATRSQPTFRFTPAEHGDASQQASFQNSSCKRKRISVGILVANMNFSDTAEAQIKHVVHYSQY